ncbi:DUF1003 domain-containing protein [Luteolibacter soli]|uniref:DUF1003 domain-containing protein n=1 Tax=Luteolibacter soli TaxID=3135280 RepID=A0ABU9AZT5_9BACT
MSDPTEKPLQKSPPKTVEEITAKNVRSIVELEQASQRATWGDRLAVRINDACGSMTFLWANALGFAVWMTLNTIILPQPWDPFPFNFLTLVVSLEAIFLSIFLLIAANRQAEVAERRNQLDLQINLLAEQEDTKGLHLLHLIARKVGVEEEGDPDIAVLEQATDPETLVDQIGKIEEEVENSRSTP